MYKSDLLHFVNSVRWHCNIFMKTTRLNEGTNRAVRGVCDIQPERVKIKVRVRNFIVTSECED